MEALHKGTAFFEYETLTTAMQYNEYILTGLRTAKGVNTNYILKNFGEKLAAHFLQEVKPLMQKYLIINHDKVFFIPAEKFLQSDFIVRELMA